MVRPVERAPERPRRGRRTWPQRLLIACNVVAMLAFVGAGAGLGYVYTKLGRLPRVEVGAVLTQSEEEAGAVPENFLIVGVDSADGLEPDDPIRATRANVGGLRSDTMILVRVDPASTRAAMVSFPRDLFVPIPGYGSQKINAAVGLGGADGPDLLVETVQDYFGVPVNHYVQVDFFGFYRLVEALDGVPIYFPHPVRDRRSGLHVEQAGCVTLDAGNALGFVRSRAYQERIDGRWRVDGTGDLGRIRRQQEFIQRALKRAVEKGIRNPVTVDELIDAAIEAVAVDDTLKGDDLVTLARVFRNFDASALDTYELPVYDDVVGGLQVLRLDERRARPILDVFRGADPDELTERSVRVVVLNGTGEPGQATSVSRALREAGFSSGGVGDAASLGGRTVIRYAPGSRPAAELLDRWLVESARLRPDDDVSGVTLVTGSDYDGVRDEARPAPASSTTTTLPRITTTTNPDRPTTTVLGTIPVEVPDGVDCG